VTPAARLIVDLRARGISFVIRGRDETHDGRLWICPADARITDAERALIKIHRAELKDYACGDLPAPLSDAPQPPPRPRLSPAVTKSTVPESDYPALGLSVVRGIVTHPLGDEFAQRILSGDVPQDEARAMKRRADDEVRSWRSRLLR
jgi:hypothetical protein